MAEVFRGDLDECVRHFTAAFVRRYPRGLKGATVARQPIAEFCGVGKKAINSWFTGGNLPLGEIRTRLCVFLEIQGYRVNEMARLEEPYHDYLDLLAYRVINVDELIKKLGYVNTTQVYDLLRGKSKPEDKLERLREIYKTKREELERARTEAKTKFFISLKGGPSKASHLMPASERSEQAVRRATGTLEILSGLNKLLDDRPLNGLTSEDLQEIDHRAISNILEVTAKLSEVAQLLLAEQARE